MEHVNIKGMLLSHTAEKVLRIVNNANEILMKYYQQGLSVEYKEDEFDPVTVADRESDNLIREQLHKEFPNDHILSEENDSVPADYIGRVWMIDPLNGTKSFIKGGDTFAIAIGLVENGVPIIGCVTIPAQGKTFYAEKDKGAFQEIDGKFEQMHASSISEIKDARAITRESSGDIRPIEEKLNLISFAKIIGEGSGAKLCMIAKGDADVHVNTNFRAGKWDIAAPQVILEEAGGVVTDLDGKPIDYMNDGVCLERSFVASANKELHKKVIEELAALKV